MTTTVHAIKLGHSIGMTKILSIVELLFLYVAIPTLLSLVYVLPAEFKSGLILFIAHPGYLQLLTTNFIHPTFAHLQTNLQYYFLAVSLVIILENNRKRFLAMLLIVFGLVPIAASLVTLFYYSSSHYLQIVGFSAVVSSLLGYIIYLILEKLYKATPVKNHTAYLVWIGMSAIIILMTTAALGITEIYAVGHLANGLGHMTGYILGLIMCHLFGH
jgi:membrane associated rhomboid family serine protease